MTLEQIEQAIMTHRLHCVNNVEFIPGSDFTKYDLNAELADIMRTIKEYVNEQNKVH